ncbi:hypothetical protein ARMSODRAFT_1026606 [Armillaria solidipes]|uniref:Uncharacterized protein n=1 Tax=Armillaria solidipes TaxID=1076256 RepID=A0A2H3ANK6_9AGAR|nr:hypothetical protein ARMSODRAFT_1026606 [Armillaria solidipes]
MAPKSLFPSDQEEWIKKAVVEYITKTAHGKLWEHGKPAPKDNSNLSTWVESKGTELEKVFLDFYTSLDPQKLDICRKKFATKFRNAKNDKKEHLHKHFFDTYFALPFIPTSTTSATPAPAINPAIAQTDKSSLSLLNPVAAPTGHDLFIADQKATINVAVKEECNKQGLDHRHHVALFQAKCKSLYNVMSDEEKETWSTRAKEMEVGQDVYHISAAPDGVACFSNDEVTWPGISNDWMKYCTQSLPLNRPVEHRKPVPAMSATTVTFPEFTEDTSVKDLRNMVKTFLEKQWVTVNTEAIPWTAIEADRQSHINTELPPNLSLGDPETLSKGNIIDLVDYFKGRIVNVFLLKAASPSSKDGEPENLPTKPTKPTAPRSLLGGLNSSVDTLWQKITGGGNAPPLIRRLRVHT